MRMLVRTLLTGLQWPLLVKTGLRNWKMKTVPVGRSLIRLPKLVNVLSENEVDEEEGLALLNLAIESENAGNDFKTGFFGVVDDGFCKD